MELEPDELTVCVQNIILPPAAFRNFVRLLYSRQYLINRAVGRNILRIEDAVIQQIREKALNNAKDCRALVQEWKAKGLISGFDYMVEGPGISFPWRKGASDDALAFMALTDRIIQKAISAKAALPAKKLEPENEKFYMNRWLKQIGFDSPAHSWIGQHFMKNLKGDAVYRTEALKKRSRAMIAEVRSIRRELLREDR